MKTVFFAAAIYFIAGLSLWSLQFTPQRPATSLTGLRMSGIRSRLPDGLSELLNRTSGSGTFLRRHDSRGLRNQVLHENR